MSEPILHALMQLFAIIAFRESNLKDRRSVVESFLKRQLNQELVQQYLKIFDKYFSYHQEKAKEKERLAKRASSSSVRVLRIATEINNQLTIQQKIVVLIRLLDFINTTSEIDNQEFQFVNSVAEIFNIPEIEFQYLRSFVIEPFESILESENIIIINNIVNFKSKIVKHLYAESLRGEIKVLHIKSSNMFLFRFKGETELYSNSQLLEEDKVHIFRIGSSIRNSKIKPIYYSDIISCYNIDKLSSKVLFEAEDISLKFKGGKTGIHKLSFAEESGRLIGIMGASGAGKSTLLNILNGSYRPTTGKVLLNGIDIYKEKEKIEGVIGHVSQDDLLIEDLTVFQNLFYNAKLCFDNLTDEEITKKVNDLLITLGLYDIRHMKVGNSLNKKISGGQRKRLNISLELIREPAVLFLDEPTSGLSSSDSENIMDLLKELTLKGKLVFVVIHQPSSEIFKMFDRLLILDTGGYLIYNGNPIDSIIYFKSRMQLANWNESECEVCGNVNPEQIFNIVEAKVLDEYGNATHSRKISPRQWNELFNEYVKNNYEIKNHPSEIPVVNFKIPNRTKQFFVFVIRDILSKLSNTQYLVINFLEAPVLAFLLSYIIRYYNVNVTNIYGYNFSENVNIPVYLFMSVIVALFMGLTVSAEEIINDRKILKREEFLNLSRASYLFSKIAVQFMISAIQAFTFVIIGNSILEIKGMYFEYWLVLFTSWCFANMLGLVISDSFKTVITIYILIPFIIIPQLILSGIIVKYEKLNPIISSPSNIPIYGEIITARWAYEALAVYQFKENRYEKIFFDLDKIMSNSDYKKNYWLRKIQNKLDFCERYLNNKEKQDQIIENLKLIKNELSKEVRKNKRFTIDISKIKYSNLNQDLINYLSEYLTLLNQYYIKLYNEASKMKDRLITSMQKNPEEREKFLKLKRTYYNDELADMLTNINEIERIIEYKGHLIQKIDPIFMDPESNFVRAHFYAPVKNIFGIPLEIFCLILL